MLLTTNSGAEVPKATMVNPMTRSDTLYFLAKAAAPSTSQLAPTMRATKPIIMSISDTNIVTLHYQVHSSTDYTLPDPESGHPGTTHRLVPPPQAEIPA